MKIKKYKILSIGKLDAKYHRKYLIGRTGRAEDIAHFKGSYVSCQFYCDEIDESHYFLMVKLSKIIS